MAHRWPPDSQGSQGGFDDSANRAGSRHWKIASRIYASGSVSSPSPRWPLPPAAAGPPGRRRPGSTTGTDLFNPTNFDTSTVSWLAGNANASGTPVPGGTLKIEGSTDLSAAADPQAEYETTGFGLERAYTRQLVEYPASTNFNKAVTLVPDAATAMPTVSSDGLTYTFTLRSGLMWNTSPPRPVTSQDFQRGILRNCDPDAGAQRQPRLLRVDDRGLQGVLHRVRRLEPVGEPRRSRHVHQ